MLQIACLLMGAEFIRKRAFWILLFSILWGAIGVAIFMDALDGDLYFPIDLFAFFLLIESVITLLLSFSCTATKKILLFFKGIVFLFIATLILLGTGYSNLLLAIILGFSYFLFGLLNIITALIVRQKIWRQIVFRGVLNLLFSLLLFIPYHNHHKGSFELFLGILMFSSALSSCYLSIRLRKIRSGFSVFDLLLPDDTINQEMDENDDNFSFSNHSQNHTHPDDPLIVHVWTPSGSAKAETRFRPIINRYIAAVDKEGRISTGHTALEIKDKLYISLYPADDIDRSPSEFLNILKATEQNNVAGEYKPSYEYEANEWCPSNRQILFYDYNWNSLQRFWQQYRQNETYNLTYRNCSSSVAYALEAALDGIFSDKATSKFYFLSLLIRPELWVAAQIRQKAKTMAWTPGLMMDYARALHEVIYPPKRSWHQQLSYLFKSKF